MYTNLMDEVEYIRQARGYNILEAIRFIYAYEDEYSTEVRSELRQFMRDGAKMLAPKETA